jgi:hypothetical protein
MSTRHGPAETAGTLLVMLTVALMMPICGIAAGSAATLPVPSFELETEGTFVMRAGDTEAVAKALALFDAKRKAVEAAYRYFSRKELTGFYGKETDEIIDLAADNLRYQVLHDTWVPSKSGSAYSVKIRVAVRPSDIIEAERENLQLESREDHLSFRELMEPAIDPDTPAGHELAKAHRLFRTRSPRAGIIYLDKLERQFPSWSEIFESKAMGYYLLHEPSQMTGALEKACQLGSRKACDDLKMFKQVDNFVPGSVSSD